MTGAGMQGCTSIVGGLEDVFLCDQGCWMFTRGLHAVPVRSAGLSGTRETVWYWCKPVEAVCHGAECLGAVLGP